MCRVSPPAVSRPTFSTACFAAAAPSTTSSKPPPRAAFSETGGARPCVRPGAHRDGAAPAGHVAPPHRPLFSRKALPPQAPRVETALLAGAAQILSFSMCRITPPSIFRCGSRRRTGKRRAMPVSSTPYCGASRVKVERLAALDPAGSRHAAVADCALERELRRGTPPAPSPAPMAMSRLSISQ